MSSKSGQGVPSPSAPSPRRSGGLPAAALLLALLFLLLPGVGTGPLSSQSAGAEPSPAPGSPASPASGRTVVLPERVLASMNERFRQNNEHWDEAPRMNRLTQLLGNGGPTQLEYMGCLQGRISRDTLRIRDWKEARDLIQLQFAVDGSCEHVSNLVGTWHTHPFRADASGRPVKTRNLSPSDLDSFTEGRDRMILVLWDVDSLTVAVRDESGRVVHPATMVIR